MGSTPLKGVDAFLVQRRPAIRLATYVAICLATIINMGMISSSWYNTRFMRQNGAFVGVTNVTSSVLTMVVSAIFATATLQQIQVHSGKRKLTRFCERVTRDPVERIASCLMAAWWLSMSINVSNMAYIYRDEIKLCIAKTMPRQRLNGISRNAAASACRVFHGSLALNWILCLFWVIRSWRTYTRESFHFDSSIFKEPSPNSTMMDLYSAKMMNDATTPHVLHHTDNNTNNAAYRYNDGSSPMPQSVFNQEYMSNQPGPDFDRPPTQLSGCRMCDCPDCKSVQGYFQQNNIAMATPQMKSQQSALPYGSSSAAMYGGILMANNAYNINRSAMNSQPTTITAPIQAATAAPLPANLSATADNCCQNDRVPPPPVVGTATLVTEPYLKRS
ncbi:hypothetical protein GGI11_000557 [Coemansia sp. RSA 2049]|nr:hypothetical protein GGI11_000557 [Coemansia sp. RSA 2049]